MSDKTRLRLDLAYAGTFFHGWAAQPGLRTVEGTLADALATVLRRPVAVTVAGRTDAGVHAAAQVAHLDVSGPERDALALGTPAGCESFRRRVQGLIGREYSKLWQREGVVAALGRQEAQGGSPDLVLQKVNPVSSTFDARFSAVGRRYCYRIVAGVEQFDPRARTDVTWMSGVTLDREAIEQAAALLLGEHDFLSFCRPREGATTIRTLREATLVDTPAAWELWFGADAFCHSMVRSLVGALLLVGRGKKPVAWVVELLQDPSRQHGVPVAPARGLTLQEVIYPAPELWEERARTARRRRDGKDCNC